MPIKMNENVFVAFTTCRSKVCDDSSAGTGEGEQTMLSVWSGILLHERGQRQVQDGGSKSLSSDNTGELGRCFGALYIPSATFL